MKHISRKDGAEHKVYPLGGHDFLMKSGRTGNYMLSAHAAPNRALSRGEAARVLKTYRQGR